MAKKNTNTLMSNTDESKEVLTDAYGTDFFSTTNSFWVAGSR